MNASKEEAKEAQLALENAALLLDKYVYDKIKRDEVKRKLMKVESFIEAAERKLPSEKSYEREKQRKRTAKEPKSIQPDDTVTITGHQSRLFRVLSISGEIAEIEGYGAAKLSDLTRLGD